MITLPSLPNQFQPAHASFIQLDVVLAASSACVSTAIRLNAPLSELPRLLNAAIQDVPRFDAVIMHPQTLNRNKLPKATTPLSTTPPSSPDCASPRTSVDASTRTSPQFPWHQNSQSSGDSDRKSSNDDAPLVFDISDREDEICESAVNVDTNDAAVNPAFGNLDIADLNVADMEAIERDPAVNPANGNWDTADHNVEDMEAIERDAAVNLANGNLATADHNVEDMEAIERDAAVNPANQNLDTVGHNVEDMEAIERDVTVNPAVGNLDTADHNVSNDLLRKLTALHQRMMTLPTKDNVAAFYKPPLCDAT